MTNFVSSSVLLLLLVGFIGVAEARHRCIWATGSLQCKKDPSKQANVEIRAYDRDGFSIFKIFDPDDLMGVTFTNDDGTFQLDGCGSDMNFFPGIENDPEPYIRIHHYCNGEEGEDLELPEFYDFVPNSHDVGVVELDVEVERPSPKSDRRDYYNYRTSTTRRQFASDGRAVTTTAGGKQPTAVEEIATLSPPATADHDDSWVVPRLYANDDGVKLVSDDDLTTTATPSATTVRLQSDDGDGSSTTRRKTIFDD